MQKDLFKVYNNTSLKPFFKRQDKYQRKDRYDEAYNVNNKSFKYVSNIYGRRGVSTAGKITNYY